MTEGSNTLSVIYGTTGDNGLTAVSGIQQDLNVFTSFSCDEATLTPGLRVNYIPTGCGSPSPTPTHSNGYTDSNGYSDSYCDCYGDCYSYAYFNANSYAHIAPAGYSHSKTSPNPEASPVA